MAARQTMQSKYTITFHELATPISQPVTKFGGQPVWHASPAWPLSRSTGKPMRFLCQVALDPAIFGDVPGQMAYIFMTDEDEFIDGTWEPEGGENALIVQPGSPSTVETTPQPTGPSLYKMVERPGQRLLAPADCEFAVELTPGEDLDFEDLPAANWHDALEGNKIGGTPGFLQGPEFPAGQGWRLLLQLDSADVPFSVNFGDAGIAYAFLSSDGTQGKFLWQCL